MFWKRSTPCVSLLVSLLLFATACEDDLAAGSPPSQASTGATSGASTQSLVEIPQGQSQPEHRVQVVTTSNIIADWVRAVGQDRVEVLSLLPANSDPHTYQPGARDITRIADADMVMSAGLALEAAWLDKLIRNAAQDPDRVVALGNFIDPIDFATPFYEERGHAEQEDGGPDHGEIDPHFWFDPLRVKQAINGIAAQLSAVDPAGQTSYRANAEAYNRELDALHAWIEGQVASLPEERRLLVTSHDSFRYLAVRYGFKVVGAILPSSTDAGPTAQDLSALIETIQQEGAQVVFTERSHSDRLARRVVEETGATLIGGLYTGSLGERGGEAGAYLDFMRYNIRTIVEALK